MGNTQHAERGLLSDFLTLLPYEILQFTLKKGCTEARKPHKGPKEGWAQKDPPL